MSTDVVLLVLRIVSGALLLAFLGTVLGVLWRDYHVTARVARGARRRHGQLVVIRAGQADGADGTATNATPVGAAFPLLPITSMGRAPTNTIVLHDTFCSQEHALIARREGQWWLEDCHSSNGTLLNGELLDNPVVVTSGDVIGIGQIQLRLELE